MHYRERDQSMPTLRGVKVCSVDFFRDFSVECHYIMWFDVVRMEK